MAKSKKKGEGKSSPKIDPNSEALRKSNTKAKEDREAGEAKVVSKKKEEQDLIKSFDPKKLIEVADIPEGTKAVYITPDGQLFLNEGFARKHGAKRKLQVITVTI